MATKWTHVSSVYKDPPVSQWGNMRGGLTCNQGKWEETSWGRGWFRRLSLVYQHTPFDTCKSGFPVERERGLGDGEGCRERSNHVDFIDIQYLSFSSQLFTPRTFEKLSCGALSRSRGVCQLKSNKNNISLQVKMSINNRGLSLKTSLVNVLMSRE